MTYKTLRIMLLGNIALLALGTVVALTKGHTLTAACNLIWVLCCLSTYAACRKSEELEKENQKLANFIGKILKHTEKGGMAAVKLDADGTLHIYPAIDLEKSEGGTVCNE